MKCKPWFKIYHWGCSLLALAILVESQTTQVINDAPVASAEKRSNRTTTLTALPVPSTTFSTTTVTISTTPQPATAASLAVATITVAPQRVETPPTLPEFILTIMKKYGASKAIEAFQSLDQLPLGLIMKVLLVEMDRNLAVDIVAMQRYAQGADKSVIQMIGRIVAGDKNVPKEIFAMDFKLMKFPWWMRIRHRMMSNLEKYVAAYSLVPVAAKTALNGATSGSSSTGSFGGLESLGPQPELTAAVAASATEPSSKVQQIFAVSATEAPAPSVVVPTADNNISGNAGLRLSLLDPLQQQQILDTLALANAASATQAQVQQLLQHQQQQQQATSAPNPFAFLFG